MLHKQIDTDPMPHTNTAVRVAGSWLAVASSLMIVTLALHGPIAPDLNDQLQGIAERAVAWSAIHWIAAAAMSAFALSGIVVLTSASRLTQNWWTMTAWGALPIAALWTLTTAVAEATVVADAAVSGTMESFAAWWSFAEGMANGFAFLALAVAIIALNEALSTQRVTSAWSAWTGMAAAIASFFGWSLGMWFGVGLGSLLWVVASLVMCLWTLSFGVAVVRSEATTNAAMARA